MQMTLAQPLTEFPPRQLLMRGRVEGRLHERLTKTLSAMT